MANHTIALDDTDEALLESVAPDAVDRDAWLAAVVVKHLADAHVQDKARTLQRGADGPDMADLLATQDQMPMPGPEQSVDDAQDASGRADADQEADGRPGADQ